MEFPITDEKIMQCITKCRQSRLHWYKHDLVSMLTLSRANILSLLEGKIRQHEWERPSRYSVLLGSLPKQEEYNKVSEFELRQILIEIYSEHLKEYFPTGYLVIIKDSVYLNFPVKD